MNADNRRLDWILGGALLSLMMLPWYKLRGGFFGLGWLDGVLSEPDRWPGLFQAVIGRWQLWPIILLAGAALWLRLRMPSGAGRGRLVVRIGVLGLGWMIAEGLAVGTRGWNWGLLEAIFGQIEGQPAFGAGAVILSLLFTCLISFGAAERGALKGDGFVLTSIALLILLVGTFVFYPILSIFTGA
ncbi:MAG: iron ABC transporter permease, partial [Paracoccus sp. (in: a-proteobacteria)]